jgi:hypothetical protein
MMVKVIAILLLLSSCSLGIRIESCPPEDAAFVTPSGQYVVLPEGWLNDDSNWWPVAEEED